MSTRVIDETTLRICFPSNPNAELPCLTTDNTRFALNSSMDQDMDTCNFSKKFFFPENNGLKRQSTSNRGISKKGKKPTKREEPLDNEKKKL